MFNRVLALLNRSLRVEARTLQPHLNRLAFVGFIGLNLMQAHSMGFIFGAPGRQFFSVISYLNFAFITLAGLSFFVTAITEEKEEETLGLFKMAGVHPLGILLGKSTSRLISAVLLLLVQLPFTLLAITLGGITLQQVVDVYCALAAYLLLIANLGLCCSVICARSSQASGLMAVLLIGFFALPPIGRQLLGSLPAPGPAARAGLVLCEGLYSASILTRLTATLSTGFNASVFGPQLISNLAAAVSFFLISWALFDRCTRNLTATTAPVSGWLFQPTRRGRFSRPGRVWNNAVLWKDFHFVSGGKTLFMLKFLVYGALAVALPFLLRWLEPGRPPSDGYGELLMSCAGVVFLVEASVYASHVFQCEMKWNTLPALILLPIPTRRIAWTKVAGCALGLIPICFYFELGCILAQNGRQTEGSALELQALWVAVLYYLVFLHLTALLSLIYKWGSLPAALFCMAIFTGCCCSPLAPMNAPMNGIGVVYFLVMSACIFVLQLAIHERLKTVAAE